MSDDSSRRVNELLMEQMEQMANASKGSFIKGVDLKDAVRCAETIHKLALATVTNKALVLKANLLVSNSMGDMEMPEMIDSSRRAIENNRRELA